MKKKWIIKNKITPENSSDPQIIIQTILKTRGITDISTFLSVPPISEMTPQLVGISPEALVGVIARIDRAIKAGETIVVYGDYDADGITSTTILWETLYSLGAKVTPYIPDRFTEGYGFSLQAIEKIKKEINPTLIITVDHGITAAEKIAYAQTLGIEVIVTDHHSVPDVVPDCLILHTTQLCAAGIAYVLSVALLNHYKKTDTSFTSELLALSAIGTIADLVPLTGANRMIVYHGLSAMRKTTRVGLLELIAGAGLVPTAITPYEISHMIAPRLNAMGRLVHGLDAVRLLCTRNPIKARQLAEKLHVTNKERQDITEQSKLYAQSYIEQTHGTSNVPNILVVSDASFNQGIIGLIAGRLVENYYRPSIVIAQGESISKASARSITGFNIIEAIRHFSDLLLEAGGHPMAAGFTLETKNIPEFTNRISAFAQENITVEMLERKLMIDMQLPFSGISEFLYAAISQCYPFGVANPAPLFMSENVTVVNSRVMGCNQQHLRLLLSDTEGVRHEAVAFSMAHLRQQIHEVGRIDVAYGIDINEWKGKRTLQLKLADIHFPTTMV